MLYVDFASQRAKGGRSMEKDIDDLIFGTTETVHSER